MRERGGEREREKERRVKERKLERKIDREKMGKEEKLKNEFVMLSLFASFVHLLSVRLDAAKFGDLFSPITKYIESIKSIC